MMVTDDGTPLFALWTMAGLGHSIVLGIVLFVLFLLASLFSFFWVYVWAWIDDAKPTYGFMTVLLCKIWKKRNLEYCEGAYGNTAVIIFLAPFAIWLMLSLHTLTLAILCGLALAHLTRYVRRLHKTFREHVADKNAHKE